MKMKMLSSTVKAVHGTVYQPLRLQLVSFSSHVVMLCYQLVTGTWSTRTWHHSQLQMNS